MDYTNFIKSAQDKEETLPSLDVVEMALAEKSLEHFIKQAWHVLEPNEPYIGGWHI